MSLQTYHVFDYNIQMKLLKILRISLSFSRSSFPSLRQFVAIAVVLMAQCTSYSFTLIAHYIFLLSFSVSCCLLGLVWLGSLSSIHSFLAISVDEFVRFRHINDYEPVYVCGVSFFPVFSFVQLWLMSFYSRVYNAHTQAQNTFAWKFCPTIAIISKFLYFRITSTYSCSCCNPHSHAHPPCPLNSSAFKFVWFVFCRIGANKKELIL